MSVALTVADVMTEDVRTTAPGTAVLAVARQLREADVGSLVVVEDGDPVGIVTATDLLDLLAAEGDPTATTVAEVMSAPLLTAEPRESVTAAVERLREHDVTKLAVVEDGVLVGVVTTTDVSHYVPQVLHRRSLRPAQEPEPRFRVQPETAYEREGWTFECHCVEEGGVHVGDRVAFSKVLDDEDVRAFAEASGDTNRLHLDDEYAAETRFGRRIVHGTLVGGLVSAALARLPGLTIYLSQDLSFLGPVDVGERVTATCEVVEDLGRDRYLLTTDVAGADGEGVVEGEAVVLIDELPALAAVEVEPVD